MHTNLGDNMIVRLGYVAISKTMEVTTSHTMTYTSYVASNKDNTKLDKIIKSNLKSLDLLIDYNIKNNIHFYRLTSKLIPLATHKDVDFDYVDKYKDEFNNIGKKIKSNNMRVDTHPDQFAVLNSTRKEVVDNTYRILKYHYNILKLLGIDPVIILHVGSSEFGKKSSISRFINNFSKLDQLLQKSIVVENDDKVYDVLDVLELCNKINVPFVLDYHHYICNNSSNIDIKDYMSKIFSTWNGKIPKIHFSSPKSKSKKEFRSHSDYIDVFEFIKFIEMLKPFNTDVDIMLEAKEKDDALFRLVRQLKLYTDYKFIDESSFEI